MENPDADQLPEVDSMPDGFVDSSIEHLAPQTPNFEQEKPVNNSKDVVSELEHSNEASLKFTAYESQKSHGRAEKTEKLRTFPVPLSDLDGFEANLQLAEVPDESCVEGTEGTAGMPDPAVVSKASVGVSECSEVKKQAQGSCQSSEKSIEGGSDVNAMHRKETSSESTDTLRNGKQEATETKRKNTKRSFKSEKEFLEFTLKYHQVIAERDAAISVRDKLESLCRELQRQNKTLMDECKRVSTEGQSLRLDLSAKFQDAIKDVSNKLEEQKDESLLQLKENEMLRIKLKQLVDQYDLSEEQHAQKFKQKNLELQIADLKIKQHEAKLVQEKSQMKLYAEQVSQLLATEKNLRLQLTADGEKFQEALLKSSEVFETFKQEIEKMAKSIKELKKENLFLKSKSEKSDVTLIELVGEREILKKQLEKMKKQKEKLESLCRSLQAERKQASTGTNNSESAL